MLVEIHFNAIRMIKKFFMYKEKRIVAIIPAREGSKGIKNKNIKKLNGLPLISYSILSAKKKKPL